MLTDCGFEIYITGSTISSFSNVNGLAIVTYVSDVGHWFDRFVFSFEMICLSNGTWIVQYPVTEGTFIHYTVTVRGSILMPVYKSSFVFIQ